MKLECVGARHSQVHCKICWELAPSGWECLQLPELFKVRRPYGGIPVAAQDAVVARQYLTDHATFVRTARMWTGARPSAARFGLLACSVHGLCHSGCHVSSSMNLW